MAGDSGLAVLRRLAAKMPKGSEWRGRLEIAAEDQCIGVHLGIFVEPYLEAILDGRKTIESRFGVHRHPPFGRVTAGDIILLKRSGGPVVGVALAGLASYHELNPEILDSIRRRFAHQLYAQDDAFWAERSTKRFATLIHLADAIAVGMLAVEKHDRRGWVTYRSSETRCRKLF